MLHGPDHRPKGLYPNVEEMGLLVPVPYERGQFELTEIGHVVYFCRSLEVLCLYRAEVSVNILPKDGADNVAESLSR